MQRDQRLDLPPPARGGRAHGGAGAPLPGRARGWSARALNQAARELLLAQSSDWAFIMTTGTTVPYAERRTNEHVVRFTRIYEDSRPAGSTRRGSPTSSPRTTSSPTSTTASTRPEPDAHGRPTPGLKVLFVTSECAPFAKTGGLADVAGRAAARRCARAASTSRVVMPLYRGIPWNELERARGHAVGADLAGPAHGRVRLGTPAAERRAGLLPRAPPLLRPRVPVRLRHGEAYADNLERFTFLSRGALELCKALGWSSPTSSTPTTGRRRSCPSTSTPSSGRSRSTAPPASTRSTTWPTRASPTATPCSSPGSGGSTTTRTSSSTSARST